MHMLSQNVLINQKQFSFKSPVASWVMWSINLAKEPNSDSTLALDAKVRVEEQKNALEELMDLHVNPKCAILRRCSEHLLMSSMALRNGVFLSKDISLARFGEVPCSTTLLSLLVQVSPGYIYLFNSQCTPTKCQ